MRAMGIDIGTTTISVIQGNCLAAEQLHIRHLQKGNFLRAVFRIRRNFCA